MNKNAKARTVHLRKLNDISKSSKNNSNMLFVIIDTSVKDNITTLVIHIHRKHTIISKTIHYGINITSTEAELFVIGCNYQEYYQKVC